MFRLLTKQQQRQLSLIDILYHTQSFLSFHELQEKLSATTISIKEDLEYFRDEYGDDVDIYTSAMGVKAYFNTNITNEDFYADYIKRTHAYKILNYILFNPNFNMEETAQALSLSMSTVYRTTKNIDKFLMSEYDIRLKTNPLQVCGEESKVRIFYAEFLYAVSKENEWPLPNIPMELVHNLISILIPIYGIQHSFQHYRHFSLLLGINMTRSLLGFKVDKAIIHPSRLPLADYIMADSEIAAIITEFQNTLQIPIDADFLLDTFINFIHEGFAFSIEELEFEERFRKSYHLIIELTTKLIDSFQFDISVSEDFTLVMHNAFNQIDFEIGYRPFIFDQKKIFNQMVKRIYPQFHQTALEMVDVYLKEFKMKIFDSAKDHIVYTLFTHWPKLHDILNRSMYVPRMLILSNYDYYHEQFVYHNVRDNFGKVVTIDTSTSSILEEDLSHTDYDIILTNSTIENIENKIVIKYNNLPSVDTFKRIQEAIYFFRYSKAQ